MAEAEVTVGSESVTCDKKDVSPSSEERESEVPELLEDGMPVGSIKVPLIEDSPDRKRKLADLEPLDNDEISMKKQQIDGTVSVSEDPAPVEGEASMSPEAKKLDINGDETSDSGHQETIKHVPVEDTSVSDAALVSSADDVYVVAEQPRHDGDSAGLEQVNLEAEPVGNGQIRSTDDGQQSYVDDMHKSFASVPHQDNLLHSAQQHFVDHSISRKIEVPNNKVGVLIGKSGETIRYLQINSGAKIQITRDGDNDPHSTVRYVDLTGSLENINKAEQLIKDVIAEANAGGSPALVARGFNTQSGGEQFEMQIPADKVGMIIGKGGETIKSLQTKTGARIQLLPQNLTNGDASKERTVRITGNIKQIESAQELIKDVMNKVPIRPSSHSNRNSQHAFRPPRGSTPSGQWGPRGANPNHPPMGYNHQQRGGMYPPQSAHYPQPHGGGYSSQQQPPPRGWEQPRPVAAAAPPMQAAPPSGGYGGYYNHQQGGPSPNPQPSNPMSGPLGGAPPPMGYNSYGRPQASDGYGHQAQYAQPPPVQQSYGHGYNEPSNMYGQQQPGMYGQQPATPYGKPAYNDAPSSYSQPRGPQPGDSMYQAPAQYPQSAVTAAPMQQQQYPYGSSAPLQQAAAVASSYGQLTYSASPADGYLQQPSAGVYPQPGSGYGQATQVYAQPVPQPSGYSQYTSSQQGYGDQPAQASSSYGYQGGVSSDAAGGYTGNATGIGYAAPQPVAGSQLGYSQPQPNLSGYYEQPAVPQQQGYGGVPAPAAAAAAAPTPAPAGYGKSVSPQPGYGQYDASAAQLYGQQ